MDPVEQRLLDAGAAWRGARPESPAIEALVAGLDPGHRRPIWGSLWPRGAIAGLLLLAAGLAAAPAVLRIGEGQQGGTAALPLLTATSPSSACALGELAGGLAVDPKTGLGVTDAFGSVKPVRWPQGYSARTVNGRGELLDPTGRVVAVAGDDIRVGGGFGEDGVFGACGLVARVAASP